MKHSFFHFFSFFLLLGLTLPVTPVKAADPIDFTDLFSLKISHEYSNMPFEIYEITQPYNLLLSGSYQADNFTIYESKLYLDVTLALPSIDVLLLETWDGQAQSAPYLDLDGSKLDPLVLEAHWYNKEIRWRNMPSSKLAFTPTLDLSNIQRTYESDAYSLDIQDFTATPIEVTMRDVAFTSELQEFSLTNPNLYHDPLPTDAEDLIEAFAGFDDGGLDDDTSSDDNTGEETEGWEFSPAEEFSHLGLTATDDAYAITLQQGQTYLTQGVLPWNDAAQSFDLYSACQPNIMKNVRILELDSQTINYIDTDFLDWNIYDEIRTSPITTTAIQQTTGYTVERHTAHITARVEFNIYSKVKFEGTMNPMLFYQLLTYLSSASGKKTVNLTIAGIAIIALAISFGFMQTSRRHRH